VSLIEEMPPSSFWTIRDAVLPQRVVNLARQAAALYLTGAGVSILFLYSG
jgi:hypothetical protein